MIEEKQVPAEENQESDNSQEHNGQESDDEIRADIHKKLNPLSTTSTKQTLQRFYGGPKSQDHFRTKLRQNSAL